MITLESGHRNFLEKISRHIREKNPEMRITSDDQSISVWSRKPYQGYYYSISNDREDCEYVAGIQGLGWGERVMWSLDRKLELPLFRLIQHHGNWIGRAEPSFVKLGRTFYKERHYILFENNKQHIYAAWDSNLDGLMFCLSEGFLPESFEFKGYRDWKNLNHPIFTFSTENESKNVVIWRMGDIKASFVN